MWLDNLQQALAETSFWIGLGLVFLFATSRFRITEVGADSLDPPVMARSFTTRFRYGVAAASYVGVYAFIYFGLVSFGSIEWFQELIKPFMGSLAVTDTAGTFGGQDPGIGSPAWAALVTTSLLPSLPGFNAADERVRDFLHEFASIPNTARKLAEDLLAALPSGPDGAFASKFQDLRTLAEGLAGQRSYRAAKAYTAFFERYQAFWKRLETEAQEVSDGAGNGGTRERVLLSQAARYVACAVLQVEASEYSARRLLRGSFELSNLPEPGWHFRFQQVFIAVCCVAVATFLGVLIGSYLEQLVTSDVTSPLPAIAEIPRAARWVLHAVPMFILPLMFAAGVRMYMTDRALASGQDLPWEDRLAIAFVTFVGAYGLGCLPLLIKEAVVADPGAGVDLARVLPWGLAPALFAVIFMAMSSARLFGTGHRHARALNAAVDFLAHGVVPALATGFLTAFLAFERQVMRPKLAELEAQNTTLSAADVRALWQLSTDSFDLLGGYVITATITVTLVAGVLGAVECAISRSHCARVLPARRKAARPRLGWRPGARPAPAAGAAA